MIRPLAAFLLLLTVAIVPAQSTDGKKSLVPTAKLREVRKTKLRVLLPTYVPAGFKFDSAEITKDAKPEYEDWRVAYVNKATKARITLQMASDGLGDPIFDFAEGSAKETDGFIWAKSPILGKVEVMWAKKGKEKMAACTWYPVKGKTYPKFAMIIGDGVEATEVKKMLESLRWLSK